MNFTIEVLPHELCGLVDVPTITSLSDLQVTQQTIQLIKIHKATMCGTHVILKVLWKAEQSNTLSTEVPIVDHFAE